MATIPTVLYYLCCWLMVEADARRLHVRPVKTSDQSLWVLTRSQGYHFLSLAAIAVLLFFGMSAFLAVFWSIVVAIILILAAIAAPGHHNHRLYFAGWSELDGARVANPPHSRSDPGGAGRDFA